MTANEIANRTTADDRIRAFVAVAYPAWQAAGKPWVRFDVLLAQAMLETGRFTSDLFRRSNNAFGMGFTSRAAVSGRDTGGFYAKYASVSDSVLDYVARMVAATVGPFTGGPRPFDKARNAAEYVALLNIPNRAGNYATAPKYNEVVLGLIPEAMKYIPSGAAVTGPRIGSPADALREAQITSSEDPETMTPTKAGFVPSITQIFTALLLGFGASYLANVVSERIAQKRRSKGGRPKGSRNRSRPTGGGLNPFPNNPKAKTARAKKSTKATGASAPRAGYRKIGNKWYSPKDWGAEMQRRKRAKTRKQGK